ncbi:WPP domain-associated protein [Juglans microcarpa x Juglans regia]|uniref:WPP domain-associated protein n=1 Tax=Juglans microcarpa x Juglans regia TaxID=2249226 RepID=UPI001B7EEC90|nr:WPP domain-associated protein [Juglans microcarpa x Juglans regia]XP_041023744.1 WPP domain-associated protein [Juglans microcarpa x Juglans regia]
MENLSVTDARLENFQESDKLEDKLLEGLESYLQDINDRLTISRMVSDSVIKGMVSAVKQEADEKIVQKELEVARLKGMLHFYHVDVDEKEFLGSPLTCHKSKSSCHPRTYYKFSDNFVENDRLRESMGSLRNVAKFQFKMLKKEIDRMRGFSSIRRIGSGSEQLGLGGILQDKVSERGTDVDVILEGLRATIDNVYIQVEDMFQLSKVSRCEWQQEREFQAEIEGMVIKNCIWSLQEELEERFWDQNARFCGNESVNWLEKIQEISSLRQELDEISKSLSVHEIGQLTSLMSLETGEEYNNNKRSDHSHCKVLSNHGSDTKNNTPESSDPAQLKLMSKDDLVFEMTKMRRNHESKVQEMTEKYFLLKREFLKIRNGGSSLPLKKDKEFDMLKTKIPHFISRLDGILVENEALNAFSENADNIGSLKDRLESLLSENRRLRDSLSNKKKEVMCLTSQVSDAEDKMSYRHLIEANLLDAHIKHSISEDVYKCALRELMCQIKWVTEESDLQCNTLQDIYKIIFNEAIHSAELSSEYEMEDSDMESIITQALCGIIYREALKDAEEKVSCLNTKYVSENKKIHSLAASLEEKSELLQETKAALAKEKEQFELASQELDKLRDLTHRQQMLFSVTSKESNVMKGNLAEALEKITQYKAKMRELNQKLELAMEELRGADEERKMLNAINQEKEKALSLVEVKERENQMQMESIIVLVQGLLKAVLGFECRVTENISNISLRLENLISESHLLIPKANLLQRTGLLYKQRLERRCSDLEKAEVEVDLLGDEVDALSSLLEKIYIGLDHYSPILQHYPGIIEILKLVKRQLSGESTKSV